MFKPLTSKAHYPIIPIQIKCDTHEDMDDL